MIGLAVTPGRLLVQALECVAGEMLRSISVPPDSGYAGKPGCRIVASLSTLGEQLDPDERK